MMQPELLQPSWPFDTVIDSTFEEFPGHTQNMDFLFDYYDFTAPFAKTDSSEPCSTLFSSTMIPDDFSQFPTLDDSQQQVMLAVEDFSMGLKSLDPTWVDEIAGDYGIFEESTGSFPSKQVPTEGEEFWSHSPSVISESSSGVTSLPGQDMEIDNQLSHPYQLGTYEEAIEKDRWSPSPSMIESAKVASIQPALIVPGEDMEIDNLLSLRHLLKSYGEALEKEQRALAQVILRSIGKKVSPVGETLERVAFYLCLEIENRGSYLKQESCKNYETALKEFYQTFPAESFPHFASNSAILEAIPDDAETKHIVEFDMGEGIQWPSIIEAISRQNRTLKLTSIKWEEEDDSDYVPSSRKFEETRRRLHEEAQHFGLKLTVEEMGIENLVKKMKKGDRRREWLVFNCMVGLPHMGRGRSRRHVMEFRRAAKELIADSACNRGIVTFGDGDACEKLKNCSGFGSFFDEHLLHYQALLESMEVNFPLHLAVARVAMQCMFVAPYISSLAWIQKWKEIREGCHLHGGLGLEGWRLRKEITAEAKEVVREGESSYGTRIQGRNGNEMVLEWRGTSIMRFSVGASRI